MNFPNWRGARFSRQERVAAVVAVLIAFGAIALDLDWRATGIAVLMTAAAIAAAFYTIVVRPARLPKDAVLMLHIADGLRETLPRTPLEQLRSRGQATLFHLRAALEAAVRDSALKTIALEIAAPAIGLATAQELHDLLRANVAAGKRVVAVLSGDSVTVRDYLLASGASEVVANPDSALMMLGIAAGGYFLKNALAHAGVEAQTLQWKEYKGAAEMFSRDGMSPELRESLDAIITDWKTLLAERIGTARKLEPARVHSLLGAGFMSGRSACEAGLIDRTGYIDDLRAELEPDLNQHKFISLGHYLRHVRCMRDGGRRARLALIHGLGPVIVGEGPGAGEFLSGERVAEEIRRAARDQSVRAIVFRINSPGGSAVGSDLVWRAVGEAQRQGKPVVVSMGDVAGSGGYYVAMGADAIVAEPATITGSIGVVYTKFSVPALLGRVGIAIDTAKTDPVSDALSFARPMTDAELAQLNQVVGELYGNFTAKVAAGRKLDAGATEAVARGRIWSGTAAKAHGLVDDLGGLARAVEIAREKAGLKPEELHDLIIYPPPSIFGALNFPLGPAQLPLPAELLLSALELPEHWTPVILRLLTRGGAMLLCPLMR